MKKLILFTGLFLSINLFSNAQIKKVEIQSNTTICQGSSATLTAVVTQGTPIPPLRYIWSNGATTQSVSVSPLESTIYTVTVTDGSNTSKSDFARVNVKTVTADAGKDVSICYGNSTTLKATGGQVYNWNTGATTASITVSPLTTTTYTVTVTSNAGCTASDEVVVFILPPPITNAGPDKSICKGQSTTLSASGGTKYQWSTGATTASITVVPLVNTTYTVTATNSTGCSSKDEVVVYVYTTPVASAGGNKTVCYGSSTTLNASGGVSYLWNTGQTTATITVAPTVQTTYTVTVTNAGGCTASAIAIVSIATPPNANAGGDKIICQGETTTLSATGGINYLWSTGENTQTINVTPLNTTSYTVTVTNAAGCTATDVAKVEVNELGGTTISNDTTILIGNSVTLKATGGTSYLWNTGEQTSQITVTPLFPTYYTVTIYKNFCSKLHQVFVNHFPYSEPDSIKFDRIGFCYTDDSTLTVTAYGGRGEKLVWYNFYSATGYLKIGEGNPITIPSPTKSLTFYARWESSVDPQLNSAYRSAKHNVQQKPKDPTVATITPNCEFFQSNDKIKLFASGGIGKFEWYKDQRFPDGILMGTTQTIYTSAPVTTTTYYVSHRNICGISKGREVIAYNKNIPEPPRTLNIDKPNICISDNSQITIKVTGGCGDELNWYSDSLAQNYVGSGSTLIVNNPGISTTYYGRYETLIGEQYHYSPFIKAKIRVFTEPVAPINLKVLEIRPDSIKLYANGVNGTVYWFLNECQSTLLGIGSKIMLPNPGTTTTYYAATKNICGFGPCVSLVVNPIAPRISNFTIDDIETDGDEKIIDEEFNQLNVSNELIISPNPVKENAIIQFSIDNETFVKLTIYDSYGREVETLINESLKITGKYSLQWQNELPKGIYVIQLITNKGQLSKKIVCQ